MPRSVDLNQIRSLVLGYQQAGGIDPQSPKPVIVVERDGRLRTGESLRHDEANQFSTVQMDTFHAGWDVAERRIAQSKMPHNTREIVSREGVRGWLYSFQTEFYDTYRMFAYFDGSFYQVMVIDPYIESRFCNPHTGHIFSNGRICMGLGMNSGRRTLNDAYAKSVLWANGFSAMIHGNLDKFPFNYND